MKLLVIKFEITLEATSFKVSIENEPIFLAISLVLLQLFSLRILAKKEWPTQGILFSLLYEAREWAETEIVDGKEWDLTNEGIEEKKWNIQ